MNRKSDRQAAFRTPDVLPSSVWFRAGDQDALGRLRQYTTPRSVDDIYLRLSLWLGFMSLGIAGGASRFQEPRTARVTDEGLVAKARRSVDPASAHRRSK